ncbi:MAG: calcium/sodium antiporter [Deltaproteobacteria bacterium]|nr:calcium/sodium antiporter [Deltaproteobacteria bacterium]
MSLSLFWIAFFIAGGIALLFYCGNLLVRGAASLAMRKGLSRMTVGLTLVALGTSAPEFFVSLLAGVKGSSEISIGNIMGSNIANIALILGFSAALRPMLVQRRTLRFEMPFVMASSLIFYLFALGGRIARWEGLVLIALLALFLTYCVRTAREKHPHIGMVTLVGNLKTDLFCIVVGLVGLTAGSEMFVRGASSLARMLGVSEYAIGLTVVALGTSLPEFGASIVAIVRKETEISVGNVIGSNIFNILFVLGTVSTIRPLYCPPEALQVDLPMMILTAATAYVFLYSQKNLARWEGVFLMATYAAYLAIIAW